MYHVQHKIVGVTCSRVRKKIWPTAKTIILYYTPLYMSISDDDSCSVLTVEIQGYDSAVNVALTSDLRVPGQRYDGTTRAVFGDKMRRVAGRREHDDGSRFGSVSSAYRRNGGRV